MARRAGLTPEDVVEAAARLADAGGMDAVTLAAVAARLGVRSPSLYAHIAGVEALRRRLALHAARALAEALRDAAEHRGGLEALREIAVAYRAFAREHPGWYEATQRAVQPGEDDELYAALAAVVRPALRALAQAGIPAAERVHLARAVRSALHGFVMLEQGGGFGLPERVDESFQRLVELLLSGVGAAAAKPGAGRRRTR